MKFSLTISSENVTKSAENCRFGQIYLRNNGKLHFLCSAIKDFFSKCDQIRRKLRIWSRLLRKYLMGIFFCVCCASYQNQSQDSRVIWVSPTHWITAFIFQQLSQVIFFFDFVLIFADISINNSRKVSFIIGSIEVTNRINSRLLSIYCSCRV